MATIAPLGKYRAFDNNGEPLSGGLLYTYEAGTDTLKATYTTQAGNIENTNPVEMDASGYANVWLGDGGYKFVLKTAEGVTLFTTDNIGGDTSSAFGAQVNAIDSNTTITSVYANSANICTESPTLSLLAVSEAGEGFYFSVKNQGSGVVTIDPDASETIDGGSTKVLASGESCLVICNGTAWFSFFYAETVPDIASQAEAQAGVNNTKFMTPLRTAEAITAQVLPGIPLARSVSSAITFASTDNGKMVIHPSADTTTRTWTIDSNANLPLTVGTCITIVNEDSAGALTIAITSDTLRWVGPGTTGSRTVAANGVATILKVESTLWYITGTGVS